MDMLVGDDMNKTGIIRIICLVDLIQPAIIVFARAWSIIFRSAPNDDEALTLEEHSSSVVVILFAVVICLYVIHMTMALKLLSALELMEFDPLLAARNSKTWQSWSIVFLVFLIGNLFAGILSANAKLAVAYATISGICEIAWRLFGIYWVGLFIDDLVTRIPTSVQLIPTVQFFGVRFPVAAESRDA